MHFLFLQEKYDMMKKGRVDVVEPFQRMDEDKNLMYIQKWMELDSGMVAGISLRTDGVSLPPFHGANMGLHVGDKPDHVITNRRQLAEQTGFSFASWTCARQVHGDRITRVTSSDAGKGREKDNEAIAETDGLFTDEPEILLTSFYADCVPLYFFDPHNRLVGLAHAGWRGTVMNIAGKMVREWEELGSRPEEIRAAIGPSIGPCCYEVDEKVATPVRRLLPRDWREVLFPLDNGHYRVNLQKTNEILLQQAGILSNHIEITEYCTGCRTDLFFSHRKEGGKTGRMASFIGFIP